MGASSDFDSYTFRLFKPQGSTLISGVASLLGVEDAADIYNYDRTAHEADINSVRSDWRQTGSDLSGVMDTYARTGKEQA